MTFTYSATAADWWRIAPELIVAGFALLVMLIELLLPREGSVVGTRSSAASSAPTNFTVLPVTSLIGVLGAIAFTITLFAIGDGQPAFNGMIGSDQGSLYAFLIILSASGLGILLSPAYLKRLKLVHQGEYYALFLLATLGMMLLAGATSFLTVFLGLEMLSLALYVLCGFVARRKASQESGMKYFLLSSFASAFLLYGIALTYGATGSTSFGHISGFLALRTGLVIGPVGHVPALLTHTMLLIAMGLLAVGFAFKISAIPFQAWTPDVYEGAPAPVTAFMSVGTKAAAIIAFTRVFAVVLYPLANDWLPIVEVIAILTIVGGNVLALVQTNTKRLLAYSSIAHAGYLMIGIVAAGYLVSGNLGVRSFSAPSRVIAIGAILFYLLCYTFMNLGAFGLVSLLEKTDNTGSDIKDLRGLWYRRPVLAGTLAFFLLALAGFPPMAGFAAKYYIFYAALVGGHAELLIIGVLASVLGMYYYLRIIASMFMEQESVAAPSLPTVPAVPATPMPKRVIVAAGARGGNGSTGTLTSANGGAATAVAARTPTTSRALTETPVQREQLGDLNWMSWLSIALAVVGTLAMGTLLPFWLVNLANQAAQTMVR